MKSPDFQVQEKHERNQQHSLIKILMIKFKLTITSQKRNLCVCNVFFWLKLKQLLWRFLPRQINRDFCLDCFLCIKYPS